MIVVAGVVASIPAFIVLISMAIIWFSLTPLNVVPLALIVILTPPVAVYARVFYLMATKLRDESCEGGAADVSEESMPVLQAHHLRFNLQTIIGVMTFACVLTACISQSGTLGSAVASLTLAAACMYFGLRHPALFIAAILLLAFALGQLCMFALQVT